MVFFRRIGWTVLVLGVLVALGTTGGGCSPSDGSSDMDSTGVYTYRPEASTGGTGWFYMGREIAPVTSEHDTTASQNQREVSEFPNRVVQALNLKPDDVVADIGAGSGFFTFRLSPLVPQGQVFAVDIQPEMLDQIRNRMEATGIANVVPVLGTEDDPNLPDNSVDVALIVVSYHEFSRPREMIEHIAEALRPGGQLVLVEYRGEDPTLPVDPLHTMTEAQARIEMQAAGLTWVQTKDVLPQQHFMIFEKPSR